MYDVLIKGGRIYDGGGKEPFEADVAIKGGKIVSVGATCAGEAARTIDASGLAVMPGAIDAHSHSDLTLPVHNRAESSIRQGITTEVAGSCGWSMAPCKQETIDTVLKSLIDALASEQDFKAMSWEWRTFSEYLAALEKKGIATNLVPIVGQSLIRAHIMGRDNRPASKGELEAMKAILRESMEDGVRTSQGALPRRKRLSSWPRSRQSTAVSTPRTSKMRETRSSRPWKRRYGSAGRPGFR